jgi:hypothetical protein
MFTGGSHQALFLQTGLHPGSGAGKPSMNRSFLGIHQHRNLFRTEPLFPKQKDPLFGVWQRPFTCVDCGQNLLTVRKAFRRGREVSRIQH